MVRLLIVSTATLVRVGLAAAVAGEPDLTVVGATGSAGHVRELCAGTGADVVLIESRDGSQEPLRTGAVARSCPSVPGVVLIGPDNEDARRRAHQAGFSAYLPATVSVRVLLEAIRRAAAEASNGASSALSVWPASRNRGPRMSGAAGTRSPFGDAGLAALTNARRLRGSAARWSGTSWWDRFAARMRGRAAVRPGLMP